MKSFGGGESSVKSLRATGWENNLQEVEVFLSDLALIDRILNPSRVDLVGSKGQL